MPTTLKVYVNEDDALLFWSVPAPIAGCRGFAIARRRTDSAGRASEGYLPNRMGFENEAVAASPSRPAPIRCRAATRMDCMRRELPSRRYRTATRRMGYPSPPPWFHKVSAVLRPIASRI